LTFGVPVSARRLETSRPGYPRKTDEVKPTSPRHRGAGRVFLHQGRRWTARARKRRTLPIRNRCRPNLAAATRRSSAHPANSSGLRVAFPCTLFPGAGAFRLSRSDRPDPASRRARIC